LPDHVRSRWVRPGYLIPGRLAAAFLSSLRGRAASPLPVHHRWCWYGWGKPERHDETSPQTGVVAAIVLLVHVRGEIGLQNEPTEALANQTADGDLALLGVTRYWLVEIGRAEGNYAELQSPNFLVAVRSTLRKSGLQPFNANGAGHGDSCDLPVTWSNCVPQMTFAVRFNWLPV
jgi:hypothetical protein